MLFGHLDALSPVLRAEHFKVFHFKDGHQVLAHLGLVFNNEDLAHFFLLRPRWEFRLEAFARRFIKADLGCAATLPCAARNNGSATVTVVPRPAWLANSMAPPCKSTH